MKTLKDHEEFEKKVIFLQDDIQGIFKKKAIVDFWALTLTFLIIFFVLVVSAIYVSPFVVNVNLYVILPLILLFSIGFSIFASTFVVSRVNVCLRHLFAYFFKYPKPDEYLAIRCIRIAQRCVIDKKPYDSSWWHKFTTFVSHGATYQVDFLCDEFSLFRKDWLNVRRDFYAPEFIKLSSGKKQIERMLVFSECKPKKLFFDFAMSFIQGKDEIAYKQLNEIILEAAKYGSMENRWERLSNQMNGWVAFITGIVSLVGAIIALVVVFL